MSLHKTVSDLKALAIRIRPILEIAQALEEIGSLEQAAIESENRKQAAQSQALAAESACKVASEEILRLKEATLIAERNLAHVKISAEERAALIIKEAEESAKEVMDSANRRKDDLANSISILADRSDALKVDIKKSHAELASIQSKIEEMRARISAFVGE